MIAEERGLFRGARTKVVRGRMPEALVSKAKARTGIKSDTELLEVALANLAVADDDPSGCSPEKARLARMSILSSDFERAVRRLKPHKHRQKLQRRHDRELSFLGIAAEQPRTLLKNV